MPILFLNVQLCEITKIWDIKTDQCRFLICIENGIRDLFNEETQNEEFN